MTVTAKGQSKLLSVLAAGVALGMMPVVQAYQAGDMIVRVGAVSVQPDDSSSALGLNGTRLAGTGVSVSSDTQLGKIGRASCRERVEMAGVDVIGTTK